MTDPRDTRPGAASPAGWFPPPSGEAAPPVRPTEPVRSDSTPGYPVEPRPTGVYRRPQPPPAGRDTRAADSGMRTPDMRWPATSRTGPRRIPVVGPVEPVGRVRGRGSIRFAEPAPRLPSRPAGPGPAGAPPGNPSRRPPAPGRRSSWQLAQGVWQDAGLNWQDVPVVTTEPYSPETDPYAADAYSPAPFAAGPGAPRSFYPDWDRPAGPAWDGCGPEPATDPWPTGLYPVASPVTGLPDPNDADQDHADRDEDDPGAADAPETDVYRDPHPTQPDLPVLPGPDGTGGVSARPPRPVGWPGPVPSTAFAAPGAFGAPPLSAPVAPPAPAGSRTEPDELFRAWQGSVRDASAGRRPWAPRGTAPATAAARSRRGRSALRAGVPAVVIVAVGAGALLMLTGRANEMLAERANPGPLASMTPAVPVSASPVSTPLLGYPGEHGTVGVNGLWSGGGLTIAAGYADDHPAVWRRAPDGTWSLVSTATLGGLPGHLTSVAEGPQGWIAAGSDRVNGTVEPVAYQSADGVTWTPLPALTALAGGSAQFLGVAAGPGGYLVVGRTGSGSHVAAAMWWSGDLTSWMDGGDSGNTGSLASAAVPVGHGFAAVGSEMNCVAIWTSPDGKHWTGHDLAKPDGAQSAVLRSVTAGPGGQVVAAGFAVKDGRDLPVAVTSTDNGQHFTQVVLSTPAGPAAVSTATVTAVTATSDGFVAAGDAGSGLAQHAVTWTSKDGLTWSAATPLSGAGGQVTALTDTSAVAGGSTAPAVTGTVQHGATSALVPVPAN